MIGDRMQATRCMKEESGNCLTTGDIEWEQAPWFIFPAVPCFGRRAWWQWHRAGQGRNAGFLPDSLAEACPQTLGGFQCTLALRKKLLAVRQEVP